MINQCLAFSFFTEIITLRNMTEVSLLQRYHCIKSLARSLSHRRDHHRPNHRRNQVRSIWPLFSLQEYSLDPENARISELQMQAS